DLGRWLANGVLDYLGRRDGQVKYHGHRIELNDIRAALNAHPAIHDSIVVVRRDREDARLVAYYVAGSEIDAAHLREHLLARIARETIPNAFVRICAIPGTGDGKGDIRAR